MYKILSLDGGGSWAIIQLLTLKERFKEELPELKGHDILKKFDLVIANSGGSIVLAALAENWTIDQALALFESKEIREQIFSKNTFAEMYWPVWLTRKLGFGPKYSTKRKGEAFKSLFKKVDKFQMDELPQFIGKETLKIIVCTYDSINNKAKFFKSYGDEEELLETVRLTQAINGSSNAPIQYFDFPARFKAKGTDVFYELWDGALGGFNNPVVAGIIEAFNHGIPLAEIQVISIGTGNKLMSKNAKERFFQVRSITTKERFSKWRLGRYRFQWEFFMSTVLNQAKTILYEPPDWANYVGYKFLQKSSDDNLESRFIRLSPLVHEAEGSDSETALLLESLFDLDMDLTTDKQINTLKECFYFWVEGKIKNQPINYKLDRNNNLTYLAGDTYFSEALTKWKTI
jgi:hypothetical protein